MIPMYYVYIFLKKTALWNVEISLSKKSGKKTEMSTLDLLYEHAQCSSNSFMSLNQKCNSTLLVLSVCIVTSYKHIRKLIKQTFKITTVVTIVDNHII